MSTTSTLIRFNLNGEPVAKHVESYHTLLEVVRDCGLHGARESCGQGLCGCCTVIVDGQAITGCIYPAMHVDGASVATIEGVANGEQLDVVQQAFIDAGAFQCGFCTPGFILMTRQLLDQNDRPTDHQIRHYLAGNLCRCGAYPEIVKAVKLAASRKRGDADSTE
ncbi:MAG: (2Fe-2S)-binding protein [Burkholderiales bacterium]